jgi:hypothetical protein
LFHAIVDLTGLSSCSLFLQSFSLPGFILSPLSPCLLDFSAELLFLSLAFFLLEAFLFMLLFLQTLNCLEECFPAFIVQNRAGTDELTSILPFVIPQENVQSVKLKNLDSSIEISRGIRATSTRRW